MVRYFWQKAFPVLTHPAFLQASLLSYWANWHVGWVLASWLLLVGVSGAFYHIAYEAPHRLDILTLFGSARRFLLFWQLLPLLSMRAATAEPLIAYWLNFLLWQTGLALVVQLRWLFSLHAQGWAALGTFFLWYGRSYPWMAVVCLVLWLLVSLQRYHTGAHAIREVLFGTGLGVIGTLGYILL